MARFCTLYSGSSGNSSYAGSGDGGVLIDAGVNCKNIMLALEARNIEVSHLAGILITHEHIDHIKGLKVFLKRVSLPVYGSEGTLNFLAAKDLVPPGANLREIRGETTIGCLTAEPFNVSHDGAEPLGFRLTTADGRKIGYATDLGLVTEEVSSALTGCDLVVLEANYDEAMLMCGPYPYFLKQRIKGSDGHLSNSASAQEAARLCGSGTTRIVLGHLSKENNMPELAYQTVHNSLADLGLVDNLDFTLEVAPRSQPSEMIIF